MKWPTSVRGSTFVRLKIPNLVASTISIISLHDPDRVIWKAGQKLHPLICADQRINLLCVVCDSRFRRGLYATTTAIIPERMMHNIRIFRIFFFGFTGGEASCAFFGGEVS